MDSILQSIEDWFRELLVSGIMDNISNTFQSVNDQVGAIATEVGTSPADFEPTVYGMISTISENVIMPIAGLILTFIACYELIQLVISHNNLANFETWIFWKWIFKTFVCGKRLSVVSESNRFTNGKPRFKYACPNAVRKGSCTFQAVRGVELDEYIVKELSAMSNKDNEYIKELKALTDKLITSDKNERDVASLKKEIDKLEKDILSQVKNLRNATDVTKKYIQADIDSMAEDIAEKKKLLAKLDNAEKAKAEQISDLKELFYTLTNFEELVDGKEPEVVISAIRTIVERVIVTQEGEESKVNIKLKGNVKESYDDFFDRSGILSDEESHDQLCDLGGCRKLHPHVCRRTAPCGMQPTDESTACEVRPGL